MQHGYLLRQDKASRRERKVVTRDQARLETRTGLYILKVVINLCRLRAKTTQNKREIMTLNEILLTGRRTAEGPNEVWWEWASVRDAKEF